jgi:diguanylate cyclase (GGDEF)-like protein/PAS domain S-box-containing protein
MIIKREYKIIFYIIIAITCFWLIDAVVDYYFHYDEPFLHILFTDEKELSFRLLSTVCFLTFGLIISKMFVSKNNLTEKALLESEERYRSLVESTDDSIYLVDSDYRYLFINKKHLSRLNLKKEQYVGRAYSDFHTPEDTKRFIKTVNKVIESGKSIQQEYKSAKDGRYFLLTLSPVKAVGDERIVVTVVSKEITELKQMEEKLYELSQSDELTDLYNRRGFLTLAKHQLSIAKREKAGLLLIYIDVDNLKDVNDKFGHQEGDLLLKETANIIKKTFRDSDIIARIGGDEFVVFQSVRSDDSVETINARLQEHIRAHNTKNDNNHRLSISFGITTYDPESIHSINDLLAQADKSMYEQKMHKRAYKIQN